MSTAEALDIAWILLCAGLVMFMQPGFASLESGLVRTKNSINVAAKNFAGFCLTSGIYWIFGFALMFGASINGWFGFSEFALSDTSDAWMMAFFIFQLGFAATASTIVSGAVAERMQFYGYLVSTIIISSVIYPIFGHWVWGSGGWLGKLGFLDFAGSTVVHSIGGWMALAAIIIIGPRLRRFGKGAVKIHGHDLPFVALGVFILWFGWIGFNGGSTLGLTPDVPGIIVNTFISSAFGGLIALVISQWINKQVDVPMMMNGSLAGLVGVTASANMVSPSSAVLIGIISAVVMYVVTLLLERFEIDDVVGAVPVHLASGIWGTLAVALFADPAFWGGGSRLSQLYIQAIGVVAAFVWCFGVGYILLYLVNKRFPLRIDPEGERIGLNVAEHGASTEILDLLTEMDNQRKADDFTQPVKVEPHTEVGQIALQYNFILKDINKQTSALKLIQKTAAAANEARSVENAMETVIAEVCKATNWDTGHVYFIDENDPQILISSPIWHFENPTKHGELKKITDQTNFRSGHGLPGLVVENKEPMWLSFSKNDSHYYPRRESIKDFGLHSGFAVPVFVEKEVVAVLEFFSEQDLEQDADLQNVMTSVGTELGRVVERNRSEERRFQTIVDNMPAMLLLRDLEGKFILVNQQYKDFYLLSDKTILGKTITEVNELTEFSFDTQETMGLDLEVIKGNKTIESEITVTRNGRDYTFADIKFPIHDLHGEVVAVGGFEIDISDRKKHEAEMAELVRTVEIARDVAVNATQAKSQFLANMTHELRTPLNAVIGFTRIVKRKGKEHLPEKQIQNLEKVLVSADHLLTLINDILDLSKIEAGRLEVEAIEFDVETLIDLCIQTTQPLLRKGNVKLIKEIVTDEHNIFSDQNKIKQILLNLLSNAAKFTEEGQIIVKVAEKGEVLVISVADSGIGISEKVLGRVFEKFHQGDVSTTRKYGGTGLGLSISLQLAHLLGGDLAATSIAGKGSVFTLSVPRQYKHEQ